jgi:bifunctional non-homologous end joining protein LigD
VFLDYNQNARDRTTASAYSVRPRPDARVSMPLTWDELATCDPADYTLFTVPALVAERGDAHAAIDDHPGTLDALFELADQHERDGLPDAPWPPHYGKQDGEASRVAPSRAKGAAARKPKLPVIVIARAKQKADALAGLERWKARHPALAAQLAPEDVLVDAMRGRYTAWYRVRINLKNIPAEQHPAPEPADPDYDPREEYARS